MALTWLIFLHSTGMAAYRNVLLIGLRTYSSAERKLRYEQWMILPCVSFLAAVLGSVATNLMTGDLFILGFFLLTLAFFLLVFLSMMFGLTQRAGRTNVEDSIASLEALYAEVLSGAESDLARLDLDKLRRKLQGLGGTQSLSSRLNVAQGPERFTWRHRPAYGLGVVRGSANDRLRVPVDAVLKFTLSSPWLIVLWIVNLLSAIALVLDLKHSLGALLGVVNLVALGLAALVLARAQLIYEWRDVLERRELANEILTALQAEEGRRSEAKATSNRFIFSRACSRLLNRSQFTGPGEPARRRSP